MATCFKVSIIGALVSDVVHGSLCLKNLLVLLLRMLTTFLYLVNNALLLLLHLLVAPLINYTVLEGVITPFLIRFITSFGRTRHNQF